MKPDAFLVFARTILDDSVESAWRSAASRGYYACVLQAHQYLGEQDLLISRGKLSYHEWIGKSLSKKQPVLGNRLNRLRMKRVHADYALDRSFPQGEARSSLRSATSLLQDLQEAFEDKESEASA